MGNAAYIREYRHKLQKVRGADAQHEAYMQFLARELGVSRDMIRSALEYAKPELLASLKAKFNGE